MSRRLVCCILFPPLLVCGGMVHPVRLPRDAHALILWNLWICDGKWQKRLSGCDELEIFWVCQVGLVPSHEILQVENILWLEAGVKG